MRMSVMSEERSCCAKVFLVKDRPSDAGFCVVDVAPWSELDVAGLVMVWKSKVGCTVVGGQVEPSLCWLHRDQQYSLFFVLYNRLYTRRDQTEGWESKKVKIAPVYGKSIHIGSTWIWFPRAISVQLVIKPTGKQINVELRDDRKYFKEVCFAKWPLMFVWKHLSIAYGICSHLCLVPVPGFYQTPGNGNLEARIRPQGNLIL